MPPSIRQIAERELVPYTSNYRSLQVNDRVPPLICLEQGEELVGQYIGNEPGDLILITSVGLHHIRSDNKMYFLKFSLIVSADAPNSKKMMAEPSKRVLSILLRDSEQYLLPVTGKHGPFLELHPMWKFFRKIVFWNSKINGSQSR